MLWSSDCALWRGLLLLGSVPGAWVAGVHDLHVTANGPVVCGLAVGGLQFRIRSDERLIALAAEVDLPVLSEGRSSEQDDSEQLNQAHLPSESAVILGEIASASYRNRCMRHPIRSFKGAGKVARHEAGVVAHMHLKAAPHGISHLLGLQPTGLPTGAVAMAEAERRSSPCRMIWRWEHPTPSGRAADLEGSRPPPYAYPLATIGLGMSQLQRLCCWSCGGKNIQLKKESSLGNCADSCDNAPIAVKTKGGSTPDILCGD